MVYSLLTTDSEYELQVFKVIQAEDKFIAQAKGGITMYCHGIILADKFDDAKQYRCQICDESSITSLVPGQNVRVRVKKFSRDKHTIEVVSAPVNSDAAKTMSTSPIQSYNPMIGGTAAAIALHESVAFWSTREFPKDKSFEQVTETAEEYFQFLTNKHNNPF